MDAKTRAIVLSGVSEISVKNIERGETDPRSSTWPQFRTHSAMLELYS
jgi:hypothetical protein